MALNAAVVFLSAFLLFLVQPIIAKMILPRFGGSVAVWATCLVFFQGALLLGYAFAHRLVQNDHRRGWRLGHGALLVASLALLPIVPAAAAPSSAPPAWQIVQLAGLVGIGVTVSALVAAALSG